MSRAPIKKTYEQLQEILAEAERVNAVLTNDYTTLRQRDRVLTKEAEEAKNKYLDAQDEINRLIPLYDNEVVKRQMCERRLDDMQTKVEEVEGQLYGKISEYNELETMIAGKDRKITTLQDTVTAEKKKQEQWKAKLDENELKVKNIESEMERYIGLLTQSKQELAMTRAQLSDAESRMEEMNQLFELEQINRIKIETQLEQLQMHRMNLEKQCNTQENVLAKKEEDLKHQLELTEKTRKEIAELLAQEVVKVAKLEKENAELEKKLQAKESIVDDLHQKILKEIAKRASVEEHFEGELEGLRRDKEHAEQTMKKMEVMLEEANKLYQEMEKQFEDGQTKLRNAQSELATVTADRDELNIVLATEQGRNKEANVKEAEVYKKLQVAETTVLDLKQRVRQLTEEAELARRRELNTLLHSSDGLSAPPSPTKQNGDHNHGTDENSNSGNNEDTTATNGTNGVANGSASPLLLPTSLLQKLEEEKQAIAKAYAAIDEERTKLRTELREHEDERRMFMDDLQRITEEKSVLLQKTTEYLLEKRSMDEERKKWEAERERLGQEHSAVMEDKHAIDNELRKLVEQRLELQDSKRQIEEKDVVILELEAKLKDLEAKLAKLSEQPVPTTPPVAHHEIKESKFSIWSPKSKTDKKEEKKEDAAPVTLASSDEERKKLLFDEYGQLLTEINTALFTKREALNELENKDKGNKFLRKIPISNAKSAISKLENLQDKVKKGLRGVDDKTGIASNEESGEYNTLKTLRNELESIT